MAESETGRGLFASLRRLLGTAIETVQVRLALLSNEIEEEKQRLVDGLLWAGLALLLLGLGTLLLCGFVVVLFWDDHRQEALGFLSALFLGLGAWLMRVARAYLRRPGGLFSTSVEELGRDRAGLDSKD
jgi:uncharacterized membrane protein YqjE